MNELWKLPAWRIAELVNSQQISCVQVVESFLSRIACVNPDINAIIDNLASQALEQARERDNQPAISRVLNGVPIVVKDTVNVTGRPLSRGTELLKNNISIQDSPVVDNLKHSGAIIIGRSNCPPYSIRWFTENSLYGQTKNPFNHARSPGGSSGGSAAALASGMCALAHGGDALGSVRYPAWACGVYGLRPTMGTVPSYTTNGDSGEFNPRGHLDQMFATDGILSTNVRDLQLCLPVMAGNGSMDPYWIPRNFDSEPVTRPLKIGYLDYGSKIKSFTNKMAFEKCLGWLSEHGHDVRQANFENYERITEIHFRLTFDDIATKQDNLNNFVGNHVTRQVVEKYINLFEPLTKKEIYRFLIERHKYMAQACDFFTKFDLLITPVCYEDQFLHDEDNHSLERLRQIVYSLEPQVIPSLVGLPALTVPVNVVNGLPTGVQLISGKFQENLLFAVAQTLETCSGYRVLDYST